MGKKRTFQAEIRQAGGGGAFVEIPFDVQAVFGSKRPKVRALIEGVPYTGSLVRMGSDCHVLGILKEIRAQTGKTFGDRIRVTVEEDAAPRQVQTPPGLAAAFRTHTAARDRFNALSYSHQREYAGWIHEAKREETRAKRIAKTIELLEQGGPKKPAR